MADMNIFTYQMLLHGAQQLFIRYQTSHWKADSLSSKKRKARVG